MRNSRTQKKIYSHFCRVNFFNYGECVCACIYVEQWTPQVFLCLCLIKRYDHPLKLVLNSRSFGVRRPCEFRVKWRELPCLAATSEATYRSPSCCLKVVQVRLAFKPPAVPAFYGLIVSFQEHQAGCPPPSKYHTESLISQLLDSTHHIFDFISNLANPVLSCLLIGSSL